VNDPPPLFIYVDNICLLNLTKNDGKIGHPLFNIIINFIMRKLTLIFWALFWLFVYKISFLEKDTVTTANKFNIFRDSEGIPHIYAKNYQDLFFGLGYAQGQDRLFTLYFKKMFIEGRVAELFGASALKSDLEMRNIGFMEMAKNNRL
jgi:acyl-homoserine lactone acylase PvdQ